MRKTGHLAEECFAKPYQVYLMIHPNGFGPPNATFFFHDGDGRMRDFAFLEFAFDPPLLASEEHERIQRSHQVTLAQPLSLPAPSLIPPAAGEQRKKRSSLLRIVGWAASIAAVFALGMALSTGSIREKAPRIWRAIALSLATASSSSPTALPSSRTSLALHAVRQNGDLELTWNRNSPLITAATSGVISIQDGESKRFVALDSAQLRGAGILYSPTSDQVLMQLAVTTPDGTVTEAVTAILPKAGGPSSPQPVAQQPSESASALSPSPEHPAGQGIQSLRCFRFGQDRCDIAHANSTGSSNIADTPDRPGVGTQCCSANTPNPATRASGDSPATACCSDHHV